jgi:phosphoenolpyruvate-protein kinase (PTS system EI component)
LADDLWGWTLWFSGDEEYYGKALSLDDAMLAIKSKIIEINGMGAEIDRLKTVLFEAHQQIEHLHAKNQETGTYTLY